MTGRGPEWRRFWERAEHVADQGGISLKLAARLVRDDDRRARSALRAHTPPAELVREIRHDVARAVRS